MRAPLHMAPLSYWVAMAGLLGLAFGSFSTVLAWRWPRQESVVHPRSHCAGCERTLSPLELIPLVSWLVQRGRCRGCGERVHWRYPAIELASAVLPALAVFSFGPTWKGLAAAVMAVVLVPVVAIDLEHKLIPDVVVLPAALVGLGLMVAADPAAWWKPVAAAAGAAAFIFLLWLLYPGGMGFGDVKLALLLGAVLGASVVPAMFVAFGAGSLLGLALLVRHGAGARKMAVPFGPFLAMGALVALWWGPSMIGWYADRLG
ncbi:MAG: prepilin peptidase [Thermoleophilia bacterium]